jgi:hypothetical protein
MKKVQAILTMVVLVVLSGSALAAMGPGVMTGPMMSNSGSFGMMNGMAGSPVVGEDGTAYLVSFNRGATPGVTPSSGSFQSTIIAVTPSGAVSSLVLQGIVSRPVVVGNILVATSSLPNMGDYTLFASAATQPTSDQSVLYVVTAPFSSTTKPLAISLDGDFASVPVIAAGHIYVVTSDYGSSMMTGNGTFSNMFGNYNFNSTGTAKTYLYIFNLDGTITSKTTIQ